MSLLARHRLAGERTKGEFDRFVIGAHPVARMISFR